MKGYLKSRQFVQTNFKFIPILSTILILIFIFSNVSHNNHDELDVHHNTHERSLNQLMNQYFGVKAMAQGHLDAGKIFMWLSLIVVEMHMGIIFTLFISLVAFLNWGATKYLDGRLDMSLCCSSFTYWTFCGSMLAVIVDILSSIPLGKYAKYKYSMRLALTLFMFVLIIIKASTEGKLYYHAFPFLVGYILTGLVILHSNNSSDVLRFDRFDKYRRYVLNK